MTMRPIRFSSLVCIVLLARAIIAQPTWQSRKKSKGHAPAAPSQLSYTAPSHLVFAAPAASPAISFNVPTDSPQDEDRPVTTVPTVSPLDTSEPTMPSRDNTGSTMSPLDVTLVQLRADNVELVIGGIVLPLGLSSKEAAERIISDGIADSIVGVLGSEQIENLAIEVTISTNSHQRMLDDNDGADIISFDALIEIQSVVTVHDVDRYTIGAFNDPVEQRLFLQALRDTGDSAFARVSSLQVGRAKVRSSAENAEVENGPTKKTIGVTSCLFFMASVAIFATVAVYLLYFHRQSKTSSETKCESSSFRLDKLERGSGSFDQVLDKTTPSSVGDEYLPSEFSFDVSEDSLDEELALDNTTVITPTVEVFAGDDTMSDASRRSMDYDFDDIFRMSDTDPLANESYSSDNSKSQVIETSKTIEGHALDGRGRQR